MKKSVALLTGIVCLCNSVNSQLSNTVSSVSAKPVYYIKGNFTVLQYGFVCKQEWLLQKATKVNFFFRLGSKDYVDYLEQKPGAKNKYLIPK